MGEPRKCSICSVSDRKVKTLCTQLENKVFSQIKISFHYGAFSCQACSLFFRRQAAKENKVGGLSYSLKLKNYILHDQDACVSVFGNCLVSEKERKNSCKHCRFKRCLNKGMKIDLVDIKKRFESEGMCSICKVSAAKGNKQEQ